MSRIAAMVEICPMQRSSGQDGHNAKAQQIGQDDDADH
jgi:hypothetical protein